VARLGILHRNRTADDDATQTEDRTVTERRPAVDERPVDRTVEKTVVERPVEPATEPVVEAPRWARVSAMATIGLIVGMVALGATMTGLLAPVGVAVGVVGGAISAGGLVGASRRGVTGHSIALLGLLASIAAIVLGVMAIGGYLPWLDSKTDEVTRARDWLNAHLTFLKNW
jgi:hypothetical protein